MDHRDQGVLKMEDPIRSSSFFDSFTSSFYEYAINEGHEKGSSMGFMELLGVQDVFQEPVPSLLGPRYESQSSLPPPKAEISNDYIPAAAVPAESPELLDAPATPNSSSISSESSAAAAPPNDDLSKPTDDEEQQHKTKKNMKPKKSSQKRQKEPRFAFMTKSEVDHLEDGYRWRKYGQKAVKNSPFPRSYYRCTSASCNVKKRVERSFNDPSIVVTTYEGQHSHPSPIMHRPNAAGGVSQAQPAQVSGFFASPTMSILPMQQTTLSHHHHHHHQQLQFNSMNPLNSGFRINRNLNRGAPHGKRFSTPPSALLRDDGLLQDIVPSTMRKEE